MGLRELGRIPAQARSERGSMSWARQRTLETFGLYMRSKRRYLAIPLPFALLTVSACGGGSFHWNVTYGTQKRNVTRSICHACSNFLALVSTPTMSTGEENSGWYLTESGI